MAPKAQTNQYLISVVLAEQNNALQTLVAQIDALKNAARSPININVGLNTAALQGLEKNVATAVQKGFTQKFKSFDEWREQIEKDVAEGIEEGTRKGKRRAAEVGNMEDKRRVREMKRYTEDVGMLQVDTKGLNRAFGKIAADFSRALEGQLQRLPMLLDFDKMMDAMKSWKTANEAGLSRPFRSGAAGAREAMEVLRNPTMAGNTQARKLATEFLNDWQKHLHNIGVADKALEMERRSRVNIERQINNMSKRELEQRKSLLAEGIPGGKIGTGEKSGNRAEPMVFVGRSKSPIALREVKDALARREKLETVLKDIVGGERGSGPESIRDLVKEFTDNSVWTGLLHGVRSKESAKQALTKLRRQAPQLTRAVEIADVLAGPKRRGVQAPAFSPAQILSAIDPGDFDSVLRGGGSKFGAHTEQAEAVKRYTQLVRFTRRGGGFTQYGQNEMYLLERAMEEAERAGQTGRVTALSRRYQMAGEYHMGEFAGFRELERVLHGRKGRAAGKTELSEAMEGLAAVAGAGKGAGAAVAGRAATNIDDITRSLAEFQKVDFAAIAASVKVAASSFEELERRLEFVTGGKVKNLGVYAKYQAEVEETRARKVERETAARASEKWAEAKQEYAEKMPTPEEKLDLEAARAKREADRDVTKLALEEGRVTRERLRNERALLQNQYRAVVGAGTSAGDDILRTMGGVGSMEMSERQLLAAMGRNISGTITAQQAIRRLEARKRRRESRGHSTLSLDNQLLGRGDDLDFLGTEFLNLLSAAGRKAPGTWGKWFDIGGETSRWQQMQTERLRINRLRSQSSLAPSWLTMDAMRATLETDGPGALPAEWQKGMHARGILQRRYGGDAGAVKHAAALREQQHGIVNALKQRVQAQVESLKMIREESNIVDFVANKFKSIAAYMGAGFVLYRITGAIGAAARDVAQLEEKLASLRAIMPSASLSDMLEIRRGVVDAARQFGQDMETAAMAARDFAQLGFTPQQIVGATRDVMAGMTALGMSKDEAVNIAVSSYEMTGGRVAGSDIFDRIAKIRLRHPVAPDQLAKVVEATGGLALALQPQGFAGTDALDYILAMQARILESQKGIGGANAARTVGYMLSKLTTPVTQRQLQTQFGIQFGTGKGNELRPFADILSDIAKLYKSTEGSAAAQNLLGILAGPRQARQIINILNDWEKVSAIAAESTESFGESQKQAAITMDALTKSLGIFGTSLRQYMDELLRAIGVMGNGVVPNIIKAGASLVGVSSKAPIWSLAAGGAALAGGSYLGGRLATGLAGALGAGVGGAAAGALPGVVYRGAAMGGAAAGVGGVFARLGTVATGTLMPWLAAITAIVVAILGAGWFINKLFGGGPTSGETERQRAVIARYGGLARQYGTTPSAMKQTVQGMRQTSSRSLVARFGTGILTGNDTDPTAYASWVNAASTYLVSQGYSLPDNFDERSQIIGDLLKTHESYLLTQPRTKMKKIPITRTRRVPGDAALFETEIVGYRESPAGELTDTGREVIEVRKLRQAMMKSGNRPSALIPQTMSGSIPFRDRLLETLIGYSARREEISMLDRFSGTVGYDAVSQRRGAARGLLEGLASTFSQVQADVLRAQMAKQVHMLQTGEEQVDLEGLTATGATAALSASLVQKGLTMDSRIRLAKMAASQFAQDQTLIGQMPAEFTQRLAKLVAGADKIRTPEQARQFLKEVLETISGIEAHAKGIAEAAEREWVARERARKAIEHQRDNFRATVEAMQSRARAAREAGIALAELGLPGAALGLRHADLAARGGEEAGRIRMEAVFERQLIDQRVELSVAERERQKEDSRLNEDRNVWAAQQRAIIDAERFVVDQQIALMRDRKSFVSQELRSATSGLRGVLGQPWSEAFAGSRTDVVERILRPALSGVQQRLADNFVDSWFGPDGVFGAKLSKVFSLDLLMDREILVREQFVAQLAAATGVNVAVSGATVGAAGAAAAASGGYQTFYNPTTGERTTVFVPGVAGASTGKGNARKAMLDQAKALAAAQGGMFLAGALNSRRGVLGGRMGAHGGNNYASEGASIGSLAGTTVLPWAVSQLFGSAMGAKLGFLGGPIGVLAGGVIGGLLGGIFGKGRKKDTPEYMALEAIERNTREAVSVIENQTRMLTLDNRLIGLPSTFRYPGYAVSGGGLAGTPMIQENHYEIIVQGASRPQETAQAVVAAIKEDKRGAGNFSSRRR